MRVLVHCLTGDCAAVVCDLSLSSLTDVDVDKPDEKSIMTYVAQFLKHYPDLHQSETDGQPEEVLSIPLVLLAPTTCLSQHPTKNTLIYHGRAVFKFTVFTMLTICYYNLLLSVHYSQDAFYRDSIPGAIWSGGNQCEELALNPWAVCC